MAVPQKKPFVTPEEYLRLERAADYKSEYYAGEIFSMAGGSATHSVIIASVIRELGNLLKGNRCVPYDSNLRIAVSATGLYTYPDASVICGPLEYVLVSQKEPLVEVFFRQGDGTWQLTPVRGREAVVRLQSLGVDLRLAEVYERVEFPEIAPLK